MYEDSLGYIICLYKNEIVVAIGHNKEDIADDLYTQKAIIDSRNERD